MDISLIVEGAITTVIILIQAYFFYQIGFKINELNYCFPSKVLNEKNLIQYSDTEQNLKIISIDQKESESFIAICSSINKYLIKNHGAVDFEIIKSIVERTIDGKEEEVNANINLPLYVGLMGTFLGIITGLINISIFGVVEENNINSFVGGVLIAMGASFIGLLLTVINNSYRFKHAKKNNDQRKNDFFNFLQIELLPHLGNSIYDVFDRFKNNLDGFNGKFTDSIKLLDKEFSNNVNSLIVSVDKLTENMDPLIENLQTQKDFLQALKGAGYKRIVEANLKTFEIMERATPTYIEFIDKQKNLNVTVDKILQIVSVVDNVMNRVAYFENSINALGVRIDNADYMGSDLLNKVNRKLEELDKQFELLRQHSQYSMGEIEQHFNLQMHRISELSRKILHELNEALNFNYDKNPLLKLNLLEDLKEGLISISNRPGNTKELNTIINDLSLIHNSIVDFKSTLNEELKTNRKAKELDKKETRDNLSIKVERRSFLARLNPFKRKRQNRGKAKE